LLTKNDLQEKEFFASAEEGQDRLPACRKSSA
jgi:hypothetical protein